MLFERRQKVIELAMAFGSGSIDPPVVKRKIGIEELLCWAYREELPKEGADRDIVLPRGFVPGWMKTASFLETLSAIDNSSVNRYGLILDTAALSEPHADAIIVAECVKELDEFELGLPDEWDPFSDLGDMGGLRAGAVADVLARLVFWEGGKTRMKTPPSVLILKYAILGDCSVWEAEVPELKFLSAYGMPKWFVKKLIVDEETGASYEIEVDGLSRKSRRPLPNAYRKRYLDPSPVAAGVARGEYEIWRAALDILAERLDGSLESFEVVRSARAARPWEEGGGGPRLLDDLTYCK